MNLVVAILWFSMLLPPIAAGGNPEPAEAGIQLLARSDDPAELLKALEPRFAAFLKLSLGKDLETEKENLQVMGEALHKLDQSYQQVIEGKQPLAAIAAMVRLGEAYLHLYRSVMACPPPREFTPEQAEEYIKQLESMAEGFQDRAKEYFETALRVAKENGIEYEWTALARRHLEEMKMPPPVVTAHEGARIGGAGKPAGTPSIDDLMQAIEAETQKLQACADGQAANGDSSLNGKVEFRVVVAPSGAVRHVDINTRAFADSDFGKCVKDLILHLKLKPFAGSEVVLGASVNYQNQQGAKAADEE